MFIRDKRTNGIVVSAAGRRRRNGRGGKAQQRYRETASGQEKRNGQSRRYRERVKARKRPEPEGKRLTYNELIGKEAGTDDICI